MADGGESAARAERILYQLDEFELRGQNCRARCCNWVSLSVIVVANGGCLASLYNTPASPPSHTHLPPCSLSGLDSPMHLPHTPTAAMSTGSETERARVEEDAMPTDLEIVSGILIAIGERQEELESSGL